MTKCNEFNLEGIEVRDTMTGSCSFSADKSLEVLNEANLKLW